MNSYRENLGTPDYLADVSDDDSLPIFSEDSPLAQHRFRPWMPAVEHQPDNTPVIFDDLKRSPKQQGGFLRAARSITYRRDRQACSERLLERLERACNSRNTKRSGKVAHS